MRWPILTTVVASLIAAPIAAQSPEPDSLFTGRCGEETTVEKWALQEHTDKFDGFSRAVSKQAFWFAKDNYRPTISTGAQRFVQKADTSFLLFVVYRSADWMFIEAGESLVMLADGERIGLIAAQSGLTREVQERGGVLEIANYPVTIEVLRKLAGAKELEAKLTGGKQIFVLTPKMPEVACSFARLVRDAHR